MEGDQEKKVTLVDKEGKTADISLGTIYDVNKQSGKLNASEEGMITEYIMSFGPTVFILYPELKVSGTNINTEHLINHIVAEIEVFEQDSCYTRTLN